MLSRATSHLLLAVVMLVLSGAAFAKGRLGFGVEVTANGPAGSTLKEVKVSAVRPNGPADKAGLRAGDIVTEFDGQPVAGSKGDELKKDLGSVQQGEPLKLVVLRSGKAMTIEIVAGPDQ